MSKVGENIYRRKDGRWEGRFISGRKPDGRAKYTYAYGRTRREAKEKLEKRKLMIAVQPTGSCRMTVKELFSWYLAKIEVKPSTRARYVFVIEHHILPKLGSVFVAALTAIQLSDFLTQKQKHGRLHGGGLSAKSVRDIGVLIKAALRAAVAEYHFPCDALNAKLPKAKQRKIEPFSTSELDRIGKALALRVLDNGQLMFQADQVAEPRDGTPRTEKIPKFMLIIQRDGVPVDVIVNMLFVGVRADEKSVLAFEKPGRKLIADTVCLLRCDLAGFERLANLVQDHAAVLRPSGKLRILALRK